MKHLWSFLLTSELFKSYKKITKKSQENYIINKIFLNISDLRLTLNPYFCVYKKITDSIKILMIFSDINKIFTTSKWLWKFFKV